MRISTKWAWGIVMWLDQGLNTILAGSWDETFSARCGRMAAHRRPKRRWLLARDFVDWLFSGIEEDHCAKAWQAEIDRLHYPSEYR